VLVGSPTVKTILAAPTPALIALTTTAHAQTALTPRTLAVLPPLEYDIPYNGQLTITRLTSDAEQKEKCPGTDLSALGCTRKWSPTQCEIFIPHNLEHRLEFYGYSYADYLRHERAHCIAPAGWHDHAGSRWAPGDGPSDATDKR
jgi:hypothetical protein